MGSLSVYLKDTKEDDSNLLILFEILIKNLNKPLLMLLSKILVKYLETKVTNG